jgi:hypothetical protein
MKRTSALGVAGENRDRRLARALARIRAGRLPDAALVSRQHRHALRGEVRRERLELLAVRRPGAVHQHGRGKRAAAGRQRQRGCNRADAHLALPQRDAVVVRAPPRDARGIRNDRAVARRLAEQRADRERRADAVRAARRQLGQPRREAVRAHDGDDRAGRAAVEAEEL